MSDQEVTPPSGPTKAWQEAYAQQLVNQQSAIQAAVRNLHVNLMVANMNGELVPVFKKAIRGQLMQIIVSLEEEVDLGPS